MGWDEHFNPSSPAQQLMKISPASSARAKPNRGTQGTPGQKENNWGWSVAAALHIPADYNHQARLAPRPGAAGAALPRATLVETSSCSRKGLGPPIPSPHPVLPARASCPPLLAASHAWRGATKVI